MSTQLMKNTNYSSCQHSFRKLQQGLTLIELMIALTISLFLLGGVIQIFASNKQVYRVQDASARIQESGRFGLHFLVSEIRMAGFMGCGSMVNEPNNTADLDGNGVPDQVASFAGNGLQGFEYSGTLSVPLTDTLNLTAADIIAGTDVIAIKRAAGTGIRLVQDQLNPTAQLQLDATLAAGMFEADDILFVSDCENSDIFAATSASQSGTKINIAHANDVNVDPFLASTYGTDAEIMKMINTTFYLATGASGEPSLFRSAMGNDGVITSQELVEGVSNMQILYGEDTSADPDRVADVYVTANAVSDMSKVVSVNITLTVRSAENNVNINLNNGDYRLRRSFTSTTAIRNRVS